MLNKIIVCVRMCVHVLNMVIETETCQELKRTARKH